MLSSGVKSSMMENGTWNLGILDDLGTMRGMGVLGGNPLGDGG